MILIVHQHIWSDHSCAVHSFNAPYMICQTVDSLCGPQRLLCRWIINISFCMWKVETGSPKARGIERLDAAANVPHRILPSNTCKHPETVIRGICIQGELRSLRCNQRQTMQANHSNTNLQKLQMKGGRLERFRGHLKPLIQYLAL